MAGWPKKISHIFRTDSIGPKCLPLEQKLPASVLMTPNRLVKWDIFILSHPVLSSSIYQKMLCRQIWRFLPVWTTFKDRQDGIFLLNKNHNLKSQQLAPLLGQIWWLIQGCLELVMFCDFYRQFYQITPLLVTAYTAVILSLYANIPVCLSDWLLTFWTTFVSTTKLKRIQRPIPVPISVLSAFPI